MKRKGAAGIQPRRPASTVRRVPAGPSPASVHRVSGIAVEGPPPRRRGLPIVDPPPGPRLSPGLGRTEVEAASPTAWADAQGRRLSYLRLSVTDRCDLRCRYCMPAAGVAASPRAELLSFEEIERLVHLFVRLGIRTVRLTGGEPLLRRDLDDLIRRIQSAGVEDLAMTTNATALAHRAMTLAKAGLRRLTVSIDSLDPARFRQLSRGGELRRVLAGIEAAKHAGFEEIKTNTVVIRGANEDALPEVVQWAWDNGLTPRFIELMPLGEGAKLGAGAVVTLAEMLGRLAPLLRVEQARAYASGRGPAGYLEARDGSGRRVGFIGAMTDNFCSRCNRVRVTARGEIRACLAAPDGLSLRDLMRRGADDEAILHRISASTGAKRSGHGFDVDGVNRHQAIHMSRVGG